VITAKLSQKFYEKLGEDITNELVNWFNAVDATYRADLRDLNEVNFARFDAKLEQRLVELDAKWGTRWSELDMKLERRVVELEARLAERFAQLESRLTWRMFAFWAPTALAIIGTSAGVVSLLLRR
jgi:hypothetical protein